MNWLLRLALGIVLALPAGAVVSADPLGQMRTQTDKFTGHSSYEDKTSPKYSNQAGFYIYFMAKDGQKWLRFKTTYYGDKWLFIEKILIKADGKLFEYRVVAQRDNNSKVWEWVDVPLSGDMLAMLLSVAGSKQAMIRFEGRQYQRDRNITAQEKLAINNVLAAFRAHPARPI